MFYKYNDIQYNNFYTIPKEFILNKKFKKISLESKLFYGLLLDRLNLSIKNNWFDKDGNYYFYFSVEETMKTFNISNKTAIKIYRELEECDLLFVKRQGVGKPNILYLKKINFKKLDR
ncbi:replication initiator protein A [Streptobacillus moniliformis]|uniref:Replication initiator A domain protein n=1 Tax=Streptobacillus moniliformis (strain ATCC 14647 / DSM 12112 / NCTC 10651 / 9901) TaxID=519441 RepID=D1AV93_STRM9|nr:replication initiator protein A [Streptobacillus moniliformis]ACZ01653.1 replication initiator A domain protein [Streptobacillus moniliformis DSM 12112]AVL43347.1 replication initiator RepA [Streptobacillus moniliformis]QXW66327.1 replication initiator protein A [Streptobacillus moniliformis]SQA13169.1 Replication initiator protein A (RepA) N-terminus [Streptobacillus moniliformis]